MRALRSSSSASWGVPVEGTTLRLHRIVVQLEKPRRDNDNTIALLTNLPVLHHPSLEPNSSESHLEAAGGITLKRSQQDIGVRLLRSEGMWSTPLQMGGRNARSPSDDGGLARLFRGVL